MVSAHYSSILARSQTALDDLANDVERLTTFTVAHTDIADIDLLDKLVAGKTEASMFRLARVEYQHALYSASIAQYRQAHISLRLFFELSLCSVLFSAHEIDMRLWLQDKKDSIWGVTICPDNGVFSKHFVGAFFEGLKEYCDQYQTLATKLYRECSEFVHGNRNSYEGLDTQITYNAKILEAWLDRADTARRIVKFAFLCRYINDATDEVRDEIEALAIEEFGDFVPIQAIFEKEPQ
uniref:hypothetical protein n=1 Tax=Pararhizobium sp. IMCC3301 TaxID=3067904 RepID=UPI0027412295|nr:hypothetical protein [Pararhizobium sp. IMCC3301]